MQRPSSGFLPVGLAYLSFVNLGLPDDLPGVARQIAAAVLGQSLMPSLIGVLAHHWGLEMIGPNLLATALLLLYDVLMATRLIAVRDER